MRWKSTAPKKKQTLLLIGLGATGILALVVQFLVIPAGSELNYQRAEARLRNERIRKAENELKSETQDREKHQEVSKSLRALLDTSPPDLNPNLWVTERVYQIARYTGFAMDSLQELATSTPAWLQAPRGKAATDSGLEGGAPEEAPDRPVVKSAPKAPKFRFGPYRAQATGTSDYETLKQFFEELEKAFPLVAVQNLTITLGATPDRQTVGFTIEWPRDTGPQQDRPSESAAPRGAGKP